MAVTAEAKAKEIARAQATMIQNYGTTSWANPSFYQPTQRDSTGEIIDESHEDYNYVPPTQEQINATVSNDPEVVQAYNELKQEEARAVQAQQGAEQARQNYESHSIMNTFSLDDRETWGTPQQTERTPEGNISYSGYERTQHTSNVQSKFNEYNLARSREELQLIDERLQRIDQSIDREVSAQAQRKYDEDGNYTDDVNAKGQFQGVSEERLMQQPRYRKLIEDKTALEEMRAKVSSNINTLNREKYPTQYYATQFQGIRFVDPFSQEYEQNSKLPLEHKGITPEERAYLANKEDTLIDPNFSLFPLAYAEEPQQARQYYSTFGYDVGITGDTDKADIQSIYDQQLQTRVANLQQTEYVVALRGGKIGLADSLLNPSTKNTFQGKDTRNLKPFLEERGYDLSKPELIPDSVLMTPTKQTEARTQSNTNYKGMFSEMLYPQVSQQVLEERVQTKQSISAIPNEILGQKVEAKTSQVGTNLVNEVDNQSNLSNIKGLQINPLGEIAKGATSTFTDYYNIGQGLYSFVTTGDSKLKTENTVINSFLGYTSKAIEDSYTYGISPDVTMKREMGNFADSQSSKTGYRIGGELFTEGLIVALPIGYLATGIKTIAKPVIKGLSNFFTPAFEGTSKGFKPAWYLNQKPAKDIFKEDTALGLSVESIKLGRGITQQPKPTAENINKPISDISDFNKAVDSIPKKKPSNFWRDFTEPTIKKDEFATGRGNQQLIQKTKTEQKPQQTKQLTETQKKNLEYQETLQKNLKKQKTQQQQFTVLKSPQKTKSLEVKPLIKQQQKPLFVRPLIKPIQVLKQQPKPKMRQRLGLVTPIIPAQALAIPFPNPLYAIPETIRKKKKKSKSKKDKRISREWYVGTVPIISDPKTMYQYWGKMSDKKQLGRGYRVMK